MYKIYVNQMFMLSVRFLVNKAFWESQSFDCAIGQYPQIHAVEDSVRVTIWRRDVSVKTYRVGHLTLP